MVKVLFTAKPGLPGKKGGRRWLHKKAEMVPYDDDSGRTRLVDAVWFDSGKTYEVTQWEATELLKVPPYNVCFSLVESAAKAPPVVEAEGV